MKKKADEDVPMRVFVCEVCGNNFFDTNFYFYGRSSSKCLWCTKFPKPKPKVKKEEIST